MLSICWLASLTLLLAGLIAQVALAAPAPQDPSQEQSLYASLGCSECLNASAYLGGLPPFPEIARSQEEGEPAPEDESVPAMPLPVTSFAVSVEIRNFVFSPAAVTIAVGGTVTWTNEDVEPHTATASSFDTRLLLRGQSSTITFAQTGAFSYLCDFHPEMSGTVEVI